MVRTALLGAILAVGAAEPAAAGVNGRIAYTTFESSSVATAGDVWTMDADGGDRRQATFDTTYDAQSDWSPDGTKLVYRSQRNGRFQVSIVDFSVLDPATRRPRITDVPGAADGTQSSQPAWFPDGTGLLYRRTNGTGTTRSDIWAMNVDGSNRHPVAVLPEDQWYPTYSPDMSKLLFATTNYRVGTSERGREVQMMDVASGAVTTLFDVATAYDSAPAWSPDGRQIAFESDLDGDMEIFVMDADGSAVRQITANALHDEGPAWSPDGTRFAFTRGPDDLHGDIWVMSADGTGARQLTTWPGRDESPDWGVSPHPATVGGTVTAVLSLSIAPAAGLGTFVPGIAHVYEATVPASVTSTAGDATLSVSDPGYLANGTYVLPQPLQVLGVPRTWDGPTTNDAFTIIVRQAIGANDALRTGSYSKTLTFTLSTTTP
jgi:dipeptidyl aminopeptidase/acylaminoacyl peptidase